MSNPRQVFLGVDTGGTFTDFVVCDGNALGFHKLLSTPDAPEKSIIKGIRELHLVTQGLRIIHGSTVATNAVLEGKGARTAFITNHGLGDMLSIGRQNRTELYNLHPCAPSEPVAPELCLETGGRMGADGHIIEPLTAEDLHRLHRQLLTLHPEAVAINLLFSFLDPASEIAIAGAVPQEIFVSRSSQILPVYREYERGIATWLNAYVGPLMDRYLQQLDRKIPAAQISVMQSSGGTVAASRAAPLAVHMLLSGPAGGLAGARFVAAADKRHRILSFDMGGTSTDVALIDGAIRMTDEGHIGPFPVAIPMVDMHTIGAGGGSIARVDTGGVLRVGPQSAGARPGPACYGRGGCQATVTDANLLLGRLRADAFLGGTMKLDTERARNVLQPIASALGTALEEAALGIVRLANEHMTQALRVISIQKGIDPRDFTLVSFGGAGGLHVCALAMALAIKEAIVPVHAGVLSALGMLVARRSRRLVQTVSGELASFTPAEITRHLALIENRGREALAEEGIAATDVEISREVDLRYRGQSYTLSLPWSNPAACVDAYHKAHEQRYGHTLNLPVELVNLRVTLQGPQPSLPLYWRTNTAGQGYNTRLYGLAREVPVLPRSVLRPGEHIDGPALITETVSTTFVESGWRCRIADSGNMILRRDQ